MLAFQYLKNKNYFTKVVYRSVQAYVCLKVTSANVAVFSKKAAVL